MARHYNDSDTSPRRGGSYYVNPGYFSGSSEFANMPQGETMKYYPKYPHGMRGQLDDTIRGIDAASEEMTRETSKHLSNSKV